MDKDTQDIIDKIESGKIAFRSFKESKFGGSNGQYEAETAVGTLYVTRRYAGCDMWAYEVWLDDVRLLVNGREIFSAIYKLEHRNDPDEGDRWANESDSAMHAIRSL